ncbi:MAG: aminomethyl-transferring glycine dehydrogenase subunit GcvPB [Firmicutes bacterium]|jgi:glycine dehydrogenase subunit 2|nr:aminomethyl-transferring glycine dehydrogenase subunit GcvPB [Bacillota bacterium]NLO66133.1 aminomethyl-transferring glycine dehydrogenase subunit GcvPB [Bacillota bacterium]
MTAKQVVPLIFERSSPGRRGYRLPDLDVPEVAVEELIPAEFLREEPPELPEVSELDVVRHYTQLSRLNYAIDVGFYPLGSCTMKYNPRVHEDLASMPGFANLHPYQPEESVQGALQLMYELGEYLAAISGLSETTLQPAAGAHGELTGLMVIKAYHEYQGEGHRNEIIVPDSAHGTNPATTAMVGYKVVEVPSDERGGVNVEELRKLVGPNTAGLMLTNPNTLGLFDENITEIAKIVHDVGGLLYYDGANANAILGIVRPGDMGFDVVHYNLHKTFSTPHGGGGPGAGPIVVSKELAPFLPEPVVRKDGDRYYFHKPEHTIGRMKSFYGHFLVCLRAYAYIRSHGPSGLREVSETAVLHANYMMRRLQEAYELPYDRICMHEFVLSGVRQKEMGVKTLDIAKRLLDYGYHAPTVYFPLNVDEAIMIEPTETESKATLDEFIEVMLTIAREAEENPELVLNAPSKTPVTRLDESRAARQPVLRWQKEA